MIEDLLANIVQSYLQESVQPLSILLLGPPGELKFHRNLTLKQGVGKTTLLRDVACELSKSLRTIVVDTSNEIAGSSNLPHKGIGRARRMQVSNRKYQHDTLIEAVQNHNPQVIVIDEIGTKEEVNAARTLAQRGVSMIATAHGISLNSLMKNPDLLPLLGGIQPVILGDAAAR